MGFKIIIVLILTFIINIVATLAYSVRIVGVKTGRIAVASAVFSILTLVSRTANSFQAPILGKKVEMSIKYGQSGQLIYLFRWILLVSTLATIFGALLIPTFIKLFTRAVESFSMYRSIPKLMLHAFSKSGIEQFKRNITVPNKQSISHIKNFKKIPKKIVLLNTIACSLLTVGVLASTYAGCLSPDIRYTCGTLSSIINGVATIAMAIFVDPYLSIMTDDVIRGECSEEEFKRCTFFIIGGFIVGTIFAQILLVPAAKVISFVAQLL